jgi:hypothetical protein
MLIHMHVLQGGATQCGPNDMFSLAGEIFNFQGRIALDCRISFPKGSEADKTYGSST